MHNVSIYSMRVRCAVDQGKGSSTLQFVMCIDSLMFSLSPVDLETHGCTSEVKEVLPGHTRKKFVLLLRRFSLEGMAGVAGKDKVSRSA